MPQPGVTARLVWGCVSRVCPAASKIGFDWLARIATLLLAAVIGTGLCLARTRQAGSAGEPAKSASAADDAKPVPASDGAGSKSDNKSDDEKAEKKDGAPVPESVSPAPQDTGRRNPPAASEAGQPDLEVREHL